VIDQLYLWETILSWQPPKGFGLNMLFQWVVLSPNHSIYLSKLMSFTKHKNNSLRGVNYLFLKQQKLGKKVGFNDQEISHTSTVVTLTLGSRPRQGLVKLWAKSEAHESHLCSWECEGMKPHAPKWPPILGVGVSMDYWIKGRLQGPNSLNWKVLCIIGKLLDHRYPIWAPITHLGT
jgi:hypothetical protein